jgi:multidrug efflux pump
VILSGVIALTLSPMMCSVLLRPAGGEQGFAQRLDRLFEQLKQRYQRWLHVVLDNRPVTAVFIVVVLVSCFFLYTGARKELAPTEDQSVLFISATAPPDATLNYVTRFTRQFNAAFDGIAEKSDYFIVNGMGAPNNVIAGLILKPWGERRRTQMQVQPELQQKLHAIAGLQSAVFPLPSLPGAGGGLPVQFVITTTAAHETIYPVAQELLTKANTGGLFVFADLDLKYNTPQLDVNIDRSKAASLGINMQDIGDALSVMLGGNYINRFDLAGRSYKVIPQVPELSRTGAGLIGQYHVKTASGATVPLSTVATFTNSVQPNKLNQFQQLNSAMIQGVPRPGVSMGQVLDYLRAEAEKILPADFSVNYAGESRQFMQEGSALIFTFFFAIIIIFLVLAAQFESFRDPLIILISVPMSLCGALIFLSLGFASANIYTQVGLVTLIGLISKHGILIVEFANQLQRRRGMGKRAAIEEAAAIRLRPVLMTTAAMVLGVTPLLLASGAGAVSRFDIGLVISTGMLIGTVFTLFVVPTMYLFLGQDHARDGGATMTSDRSMHAAHE